MDTLDWPRLVGRQAELAAVPAVLRDSAEHVRLDAGQSVFRAGARPAKIFWVIEGEIRLIRRSRGGSEIVLQRACSGFLAEASLDSPHYHCDAAATVDSRLLAFPVSRFRQVLGEDAKFRSFWMGRLAREVRALRSQCERLALHSAAERIEHYIESEGQDGRLELARTRKAWAAELGLTHEALYRALSGLERAGRVAAVEREGILVLTMKHANRTGHG
jgi:CRP-like cAMP-binding protein